MLVIRSGYEDLDGQPSADPLGIRLGIATRNATDSSAAGLPQAIASEMNPAFSNCLEWKRKPSSRRLVALPVGKRRNERILMSSGSQQMPHTAAVVPLLCCV